MALRSSSTASKDLILCSGFNVYPRRIEEAIYEHPAVAEVTVIGVPDAYRGEASEGVHRAQAGDPASASTSSRNSSRRDKLGRHRVPAEVELQRKPAQDPDRQALEEGAEGRG